MSLLGSALSIGGMIVGGVIGFYLGGPGGASLGASIGGAIGGIAGAQLFPDRPDLARIPPPQPHENRIQISSYGAARGLMFGTVRRAGNLLKMQPVQETYVRSKHRQDGVRYYKHTKIYTSTFAVGFGPGPAVGISRLWVNGQVFYDARDPGGAYYPVGSGATQEINLNTSIDRAQKYFTVYLGTEAQEPDADLEAIFGAADVPAYRGEVYIKFKDFPVGEFGGLPTIEAEIVKDGTVSTANWVVDHTGTYPGLTHHQALDDDGNLIKYDAVSQRIIIFKGLSSVVLNSFAAPSPSNYFFQGLGFDPDSGLIILAYDYSGSGSNEWVTFYVMNTSGEVVASWQTDQVYGTGDSGVSFAFTTEGMIAFFSTSAYYYYSWFYGSLMVLYESIYGGEIDRVWGPNTMADRTSMDYARYKPVWGDPEPTAYFYLGDGAQYWKLRWGDFNKYQPTSGNTLVRGTLPDAAKVSQDIRNPRGGYMGAMITAAGDLLTYDVNYDELYVHAGITNTIRTRSRVLETGAGLDDVVAAICAKAGIAGSYIDTAALAADTVLGYQVPRVMPARTALDTLMQAYSFAAAEIDWRLVFAKLGGASVLAIPDGDLGAAEGELPAEQPIVETRSGGDMDLPSHLLLSYESKARDYQIATQPAFRADRPLARLQHEQLGLIMEDSHAKQVAEIMLKRIWNRRGFRFPLPPKYLYLAPSDVITVRGKDMRIVSMTDRGGVIDVAAEAEPGGTYQSAAQAQDIAFSLVDISADTCIPQVVLFDAPPLSIDHGQVGCYAAMFGAFSYRGGTLQRSTDGGSTWQDVAYFDATVARIGQCTAALAAAQAGVIDYTASLTVDMARSGATLSSASDAELAAGANLAAVGSRAKGWEIIQFKTASLASGVYTLTGLLRGLYGTHNRIAAHGLNEDFILLAGLAGIEFLAADTAGVEHLYRPVNPAGRAGASFAYAATALPLQPLPAAGAYAGRSASGDCLLKWRRADRYEFSCPDLPDNRDAPMSELSQAYEVDVIHPISLEVLRTIAAAAPAVTYTSAQQVADGYPSNALDDDCSGSLATNFTDNDGGSASSSMSGGRLALYCPSSSSTSGANATAKSILNRQGKTVVGLDWKFDNYTSAVPFGDNATDVVLHKSSPTFATAAWAYARPEHGVGANSYIALAYHYNSRFYVTCKVRISGTDSTVFQAAVDVAIGSWANLVWEIDWTAHTVSVWLNGAAVAEKAAFSSGLDTPITSSLQATFRANAWGGNTYYMDNIKLAHTKTASKPIIFDIYQLSNAVGRGIAQRVSV